MVRKVLVLNYQDNVATAVQRLARNNSVNLNDDTCVTLLHDVPFGHKVALRDIALGENIIKYGEIIGRATTRIIQGAHVHIHNVEGIRGRGDKR